MTTKKSIKTQESIIEDFEFFEPYNEYKGDKSKFAGLGNWFGVQNLQILFPKQLKTIVKLHKEIFNACKLIKIFKNILHKR